MAKIAITTIAYNRVNSLERLLRSLLDANYYGVRTDLIISIDKSNTTSVEEFADAFEWPFGEKIVRKHSQNLGLRKHILSQGKSLEIYDAIVVLEDDVVVSPAFFGYTLQAIKKYEDNPDIAGISLYSFPLNPYTNSPFSPFKNGYDAFMMNTAQSWGQIWLKKQWNEFYNWYLEHTDFTPSNDVPQNLFAWEKSWLKYHTRYCIENNKYFVYPYHSFSTNCGEAGEHNNTGYNNYQTELQYSINSQLNLPSTPDDAVLYDGFFENKSLYDALNLSEEECYLDLNAFKNTFSSKRYLLSTKPYPYKVIKSYGLKLRPIECNILQNVAGNDIFLYDLTDKAEAPKRRFPTYMLLYNYRIFSALSFIRQYKLKNILIDFINRIKN